MKAFIKMARFAKVFGDKKTSRTSFVIIFAVYMAMKRVPKPLINKQ